MKLIARWVLNALALMVVPYVIGGIAVTSFTAALIAALVIGFINALIRPILLILTLPITLLTLGLFALVLNGFLFLVAANLVPGFNVVGFWPAVWGGLLYSVLTWLVNMALGSDAPRR